MCGTLQVLLDLLSLFCRRLCGADVGDPSESGLCTDSPSFSGGGGVVFSEGNTGGVCLFVGGLLGVS